MQKPTDKIALGPLRQGKVAMMVEMPHLAEYLTGPECAMTRFVLCADDFAMTAGVSRAIVELAAAGRLSATGAMTNRPHWRVWASEISAHAATIDIGVHLNLTCAAPLGEMPVLAPGAELPSLGQIIRAALMSVNARVEIAAEIVRQLDAFEAVMGRPPDFIDGHQHVHAMPGVRNLVLAELQRRYPVKKPYLRDSSDRIAAIRARGIAVRKALTINGLAVGFGAAARAAGFATNQGFAGVSPFDPSRDFASDMPRFLVAPGLRHLVMCHPGHVDDELVRLDPVVETRPLEFAALASGRWGAGHKLVRFGDVAQV
ncbi:MAG: ChbG/HpnK family deacetylase [Bosea sp. (in: a-proteobacteria)]